MISFVDALKNVDFKTSQEQLEDAYAVCKLITRPCGNFWMPILICKNQAMAIEQIKDSGYCDGIYLCTPLLEFYVDGKWVDKIPVEE